MSAPYMTLITEVLPIQRRNFSLASQAILNPNNANPLLDGEWLELDTSYKLKRGAATPQATPAWQVWNERGRYDTQALGQTTVLFIGGYEAETTIIEPTGISVGDALIVTDVTVGGVAGKRGLDKIGAAATFLIFAYATRIISATKIRYWVPGTPVWKTIA